MNSSFVNDIKMTVSVNRQKGVQGVGDVMNNSILDFKCVTLKHFYTSLEKF